MKYLKNHIKSGFTAIELLFAIIILGGMMALTMTVIVGMLRFYVFAGSVRKNQANGRDTLDLIARDVRFGKIILPNNSGVNGNEICVYDKTNKRVIDYVWTSNAYLLKRKIYSYQLDPDPTTCTPNSINELQLVSENNMNLSKMFITRFNVKRTQGASFQANDLNTAAIIIDYEFITGNYSPNLGGSIYCNTENIYCNKLGYVTAVNLRGSE